MMNLEEFRNFYINKGFCPNDLIRSKHLLNEIELDSKYKKYLKSEQKKIEAKKRYIDKIKNKEIQIDEEWAEVCKKVRERDNNKCRLTKILSINEKFVLKNNASFLLDTLDCAHVIRRSQSRELLYDIDNIVLLNRYSHSMIDQYKNPINGKSISKEDVESWWKLIIGIGNYVKLLEKIKGE